MDLAATKASMIAAQQELLEKVVIAWPDGGSVAGAFAHSMLALYEWENSNPSDRYEMMSPFRHSSLYVQENRNNIVRTALDIGADWLLQLDGDESFRPELLRILMRTADMETRPIVAGLYTNVGKIDEDSESGGIVIINCAYNEVSDGQYASIEVPDDSMAPFCVGAVGSGILLTHMSIFEKLEEPWFWIHWFERTDDRGEQVRQIMNEDIGFCRSAREAGYEIWVDPMAECIHWKALPLMPSTMRTYLREAEEVFKSMRDNKKRPGKEQKEIV